MASGTWGSLTNVVFTGYRDVSHGFIASVALASARQMRWPGNEMEEERIQKARGRRMGTDNRQDLDLTGSLFVLEGTYAQDSYLRGGKINLSP